MAQAVNLDMRKWWEATADSDLGYPSQPRVLEAVSQAVSTEAARPMLTMKKDVLADAAERALKGSGWLPPALQVVAS